MKNKIKSFFIISVLCSLFSFFWLVFTPSISAQLFFLNYSFSRFCMIVINFFVLFLLIVGLILNQNKKIVSLINKIFSSKIIFIFCFIAVISLSLFLFGLCLQLYGPRMQVFIRTLPIIILLFLFCLEILIFQQINSHSTISKSVFTIFKEKAQGLFLILEKFFSVLINWFSIKNRAILIIVIVTAPIIFLNAFSYQYPMGFAGLYTLMSEELVHSHFSLPYIVPYYGPGGIPFAYPPLSFYLMALLIGPFSLPVFTYLRFAPPLFYLISTILFYFLCYEFTRSKKAGAISAIIFGCSTINFYIQGTAGGITRGLALCFCLTGLIYFLRSKNVRDWRSIFLSGLFFGFTLLTHLGYAFIFALIISVSLLFHIFNLKRWKDFLLILLVGFLLSSPWWITIWSRYGFETFMHAFGSHGNDYFIQILRGTKPLGEWLAISFSTFSENRVLSAFAILGIVYCLLRGDLYPIVLFFILMFSSSENGRFLIMLGSLCIGELFSGFDINLQAPKNVKTKYFLDTVFITAFILILCIDEVRMTISYRPHISDETISLSTVIKDNSAQNDSYVVVIPNKSDNSQEIEWMPYLFSLTPSFGVWGSEWIDYSPNQYAQTAIGNCWDIQSFSCVKDVIEKNNENPNFVITYADDEINKEIKVESNWILLYSNNKYCLWKRVDG